MPEAAAQLVVVSKLALSSELPHSECTVLNAAAAPSCAAPLARHARVKGGAAAAMAATAAAARSVEGRWSNNVEREREV